MTLVNKLQTIPQVFRGIMTAFLVILMIRVTYPISNTLLGLFVPNSMMHMAGVIVFWTLIVFVTTFLIWIIILKPNEGGTN